MWEPDEQMLSRAPVMYKKNEGVLYITSRRVAWQQQGLPQLTPSLLYTNIQSMQQSPGSAKKVILKITTAPPTSKDHLFYFTSPKALAERETVKERITEQLTRARGLASASAISTPATMTPSSSSAPPSTPVATPTIPSRGPSPALTPPTTSSTKSPSPSSNSLNAWRTEEFNARKHLLSSSRELQTLHQELVLVGKNVTEEEFWSSPYVKRIRQRLKKDAVSREGRQKGKSSKMVELRPGQQEGSDVKYTLTSQIIHNIFTEFPSVKRAYDANVPDKIKEQQFWKRFLASEFFHRSRTGGRSQMAPYDDIFDRCLQEEDDEISKAPDMTKLDKLKRTIDLTASIEDHMEGGNAPDFTMIPGRDAKVLPLIRRFNRHAMRVLETTPSRAKPDSKKHENDVEKEIMLDDLMEEAPPERIVLDIQDTGRYFESQSGAQTENKMLDEDAAELLNSFKEHFQHWQPELTKGDMKPKMADRVCYDLTQTIKRKIRHDEKSFGADAKLPPPIQSKIQNYHSATNEILRHFWSSFEPYRPDKNIRMVEGLERQKRKLSELLTTVKGAQGDVGRCKQMLAPVLTAVDRALESARKKAKKKR